MGAASSTQPTASNSQESMTPAEGSPSGQASSSRQASSSMNRAFNVQRTPSRRFSTQRSHSRNIESSIPPEAAAWHMVEFDQHNFNASEGRSVELFSTRKPRDFTAGLSSGLKSIVKGTAIGAASLVILPVSGARQEGFAGFLKGTAAGVAAATALPLAGVCVAGYQITRGVINTPEAVYEKNCGKKWNAKKREWIDGSYYLDKEIEEVLHSPEHQAEGPTSAIGEQHADDGMTRIRRTVVETEYYDLLEIPTDATPSEIRRQYYKLARRWHPDKNPDDPDAKAKFQNLGSAYQVLVDEKYREQYDKYGKSGTKDVALLDSGMFFTMFFGSEKLEPFVGKLKMAQFMELMERNSTTEQFSDKLEFMQLQREVKLAMELRDRVEAYVTQDKELQASWQIEIEQLADDLCKGSYGYVLVPAIGWVYENYATQFLGKLDTFLGVGGKYAKLRARSRYAGNVWSTVVSAARSTPAVLQLSKDERNTQKDFSKDSNEENANGVEVSPTEEDSQKDEEQAARIKKIKHFEEALPAVIDMLLKVCLLDIEAAVKGACKKVLKDMGVEISVRRSRANALIKMGKIFQKVGEKHKLAAAKENDKDSVRQKIEEAFIRVAQKMDET